MPKKGRLSQADKERESDPAFVRLCYVPRYTSHIVSTYFR
jgi:hypothetical protein